MTLRLQLNSSILSPMNSILEQVLTEARSHKSRLLAIFDLDSTLFDLAPRILRIIEEFAALESTRMSYPDQCARLRAMEVLKEDWGIAEGLVRLGMQAEDSQEFWHAIHSHWARNFFSSDFLHYDAPLAGAVDYVNELSLAGAEIIYLTGRDVPRMLAGTERSLRDSGFPAGRLMLKPTADLDDAEFKVDVIRDLIPAYERIWLFENEPVNTNLVARECPTVQIVFVDTTHSGREQVNPAHSKIADFELWTRQVKT